MRPKTTAVLSCLLVCAVTLGSTDVQAVTDEEFQSVKKKVMDLERYTFPPEKAEEIKKVSEYVCPQGHAYSTPPEGSVCPIDRLKVKERLALIKVKLDRREAVGEKISSLLEEEFHKRVNVAMSGTGIAQHVADSIENSTKKQSFAQGSVDVYLLSRPLTNTLFFVDIESQGGGGPDSAISNQSALNNDTTSLPPTTQNDQVRLREAWIQKSFYKQQIQSIIGKIDVTNYFDRNRAANDETSQFLTGTFVNSPLIGNPPNGPGAVTLWDSRRGITLGLGVQSADASGVNVSEEPFAIAELGFRLRSFQGQLGNFRFWSARNGRVSGDNRDDYSLGMSADQEIGSKTILFGRVSRAVRKGP
ncbi:MAG: carbohydrate porin, partial [Elusimicrobia bacterium]|nr:carbohydrate porin [Elusimicrobiota bacterium]